MYPGIVQVCQKKKASLKIYIIAALAQSCSLTSNFMITVITIKSEKKLCIVLTFMIVPFTPFLVTGP